MILYIILYIIYIQYISYTVILFYHDTISLFHLLRFIKNGSYSKNLPYRFRIQKVSKRQLSYRYYSKLYLIIIYSTQNINPINYLKIYRTKVSFGLTDIKDIIAILLKIGYFQLIS